MSKLLSWAGLICLVVMSFLLPLLWWVTAPLVAAYLLLRRTPSAPAGKEYETESYNNINNYL